MKKILTIITSLALGIAFGHAQPVIIFDNVVAGAATNTSSLYNPDSGTYVSGKTFPDNISPGAYDFTVLAATSTNGLDEGNPLGPDWSQIDLYGGAAAYATNGPVNGSVARPWRSRGL